MMNRMRQALNQAALSPPVLAADSAEQRFCFSEDFIGFAGHFPGYPILPAILQMLLAQLLAEQLLGGPLQFLALEKAKFTRQLRPGDEIRVKILLRERGIPLRCVAELSCGAELAGSFALLFEQGATA
jgi:3-hydroxyacyl-[acyl-carrier-protein] dehydratase